MTPFYGSNEPSRDLVPDWFLGGDRRRRLLEALAQDRAQGWTVRALIAELGCGQATAYELIRALGRLDLLQPLPRGEHLLSEEGRLAVALREFLVALEPYADDPVDRPPRGSRRA
jgi:hypothetical protein